MWNWEAFAFSCAGALAVQILHWLSVARKGRWPKHSKSVIHWLLTVGLVLIAGVIGVAVFYGRPFDPLLGIQTGASSPLLLEQMGSAALPNAKRHLGDERGGLYEEFLGFFRH